MTSRQDRVLLPLLLALGAGFLYKLWASSGILCSGHSDLVSLAAGLESLLPKSLAADGRYPLWNPANNAGAPAHANPLALFDFPTHWLYLVLPLDRASNLIILLNVLLSGAAMYACARRFLEHPLSAFFCGVSYMLSYRYLSMIDAGWISALTMYALAPLLLCVLDRLLERPGPRRAAALAVVLALSLMQGSTQSLYYALLAFAAFSAWRLAGMDAERRSAAARWLAGGGALGLLLAAPDLLPRAQFAALSTRARPDYRFFLGDAPRWTDLKTLFDPFDAGGRRLEYWENNFYFGLWLWPPALYACRADWKRARWLLLAIAASVALCFDTPVSRLLFRALPGFALFRRPTRVLQLAQLAAAMLAGLGVDAFLRRAPRRRHAAWVGGLCLLAVLDTGARMLPRLETKPLSVAFPPLAFAGELRRSPDNGRVAAIGRAALPYGMAPYYDVDLLNGYSPLNLRAYVEYFSVLQTGDAAAVPRGPVVWTDLRTIAKPEMLRALDARLIVSDRSLPLERIGYAPAGRRDDAPLHEFYRGWSRGTAYLWRDRTPLGPAYFARSVVSVRDEDESLRALAASRSALDAAVLGPADNRGPAAPAGGTARLTRRGYGVYSYDVDSRGDGFLILSQVWYPGWRARLDGRPVPLFRVNHALIGLDVPPGRHALELEMTSPALRLGLWLAAGALALCALLAALSAA